MSNDSNKPESKVEIAKRESKFLRGKIVETLASDADHFEEAETQLIKFHGSYQQDDRDTRKQRRADGLGREYSFMVRVAMPGGAMTAEQYLGLDTISDKFANHTLRITTRQGIQFHGIIMDHLRDTIAGINEALLTTLSACGDVNRNAMACPAPLADEAHVTLQRVAHEIAVALRPASSAYHEIWIDGEKQITTQNTEPTQDTEPFYGETYLPRKFKTGISLDTDNCVDVYSQDVGLIAIVEGGALRGFNVVVGGGMGMTHRKPTTTARLAQPLGFIQRDQAVETARTVAAIFRDHGNRSDRKHARLKYLLAEWGIDRMREEFDQRASFNLNPFVPLPAPHTHDHLGRHQQGDGKHFYGVQVASGRIQDTDTLKLKTALQEIARRFSPGFRATPQQNLLLTDLSDTDLDNMEGVLIDHGYTPVEKLSPTRRYAMACPALPTCGLALSESERVIPSILRSIEAELSAMGLGDEPISIRMTGCPNGCARPYTADIAIVGKGPDNFNIYVGGGLAGDRVVDLFKGDVTAADFIPTLKPLFKHWSERREPGEGFGDFYQRVMGERPARQVITGSEEPTDSVFSLKVLS